MSESPADPSCRTVIVVEDEMLIRELAVCELEESGFRVVEFPNADEALRHLSSHAGEASVLFTDVQMPGRLNGLDLVDIVSRQWPDMAVLVTSGGPLVNPSALPRCAKFVPKPWRGADIVRRLTSLMADSRAGERRFS